MNKLITVLLLAVIAAIAAKPNDIVINNYGIINDSRLVEQAQKKPMNNNNLLNGWKINVTLDK